MPQRDRWDSPLIGGRDGFQRFPQIPLGRTIDTHVNVATAVEGADPSPVLGQHCQRKLRIMKTGTAVGVDQERADHKRLIISDRRHSLQPLLERREGAKKVLISAGDLG